MNEIDYPTGTELDAGFRLKYGDPEKTGWSPAMRYKAGYYNPDDVHEVMMDKLVTADTNWLDLGCGRNVFPSNEKLAWQLSKRCQHFTGVDPDETILENEYAHETFQGFLGDYQSTRKYNVISLRMVAEHVDDPDALIRDIAANAAPGCLVVIYTVNKYSPVPLVTSLVPFALHLSLIHI